MPNNIQNIYDSNTIEKQHDTYAFTRENRRTSIINKADAALQDLTDEGGYLVPQQAERFVTILTEKPTLLQKCNILIMKKPEHIIDKIGLGKRILRPANPGEALQQEQRSKPEFASVILRSHSFKGEIRLPDEMLEDNIEHENLKNTLVRLIAQRVALDMEEIVIRGDTRCSYDPDLAQFDGLLAQAVGNVVHHGGPNGPNTTNTNLFYKMIKAMPGEYTRDTRNLVFYTSTNSVNEYKESLSKRNTGLGDHYAINNTQPMAAGMPVISLPAIPDGQALLTEPQNIVVGIHRNVRVEMAKKITSGEYILVVTVRFDTRFVSREAVVRATGIRVTSAPSNTIGLGNDQWGGVWGNSCSVIDSNTIEEEEGDL